MNTQKYYRVTDYPSEKSYTFYSEETAKKFAKEMSRLLSIRLFDSSVLPCRSPVLPLATPEYDGRWETIYSIFSGSKLVRTIKVIEEWLPHVKS